MSLLLLLLLLQHFLCLLLLLALLLASLPEPLTIQLPSLISFFFFFLFSGKTHLLSVCCSLLLQFLFGRNSALLLHPRVLVLSVFLLCSSFLCCCQSGSDHGSVDSTAGTTLQQTSKPKTKDLLKCND